MITLEEAIAIAKKAYGDNMNLFEKCYDIGKFYTFSAITKDGQAFSSGLVLLVNKETGGRHYEPYSPLPGYDRLKTLVENGRMIDISDMIQKRYPVRVNVNMNKLQQITAGIMGLVVGDAMGVPVEFETRDSFTVMMYLPEHGLTTVL